MKLVKNERRTADYALLEWLKPWKPASAKRMEGTCGNIQSAIDPRYDSETGKSGQGLFKDKYFYELVSAPMLLAKLLSGFKGLKVTGEGQDAYKITWSVVLEHKATGHVVTFYDWKGSSSFGSNLMPNDMPDDFRRDFQKLLCALASVQFPHPYDGCVIGEIA